MQCPQCQHDNRESAKFCEACGTALVLPCPTCGTQPRPGAAFCDACGTRLREPLPAPSTARQHHRVTGTGTTRGAARHRAWRA